MRMTAGRMLTRNSRGGERGSRVIFTACENFRELWEICRSVTAGVCSLAVFIWGCEKHSERTGVKNVMRAPPPPVEAWTQKGHFVEYLCLRSERNTLKWDLENVTADVLNRTKYVLLYWLSCSINPGRVIETPTQSIHYPFLPESMCPASYSFRVHLCCSYGTPTSRHLKTLCLDTWNPSITAASPLTTSTSPLHPVTAPWR